MIVEVLDGLADNGPDGNQGVEAKVKEQATATLQPFPHLLVAWQWHGHLIRFRPRSLGSTVCSQV